MKEIIDAITSGRNAVSIDQDNQIAVQRVAYPAALQVIAKIAVVPLDKDGNPNTNLKKYPPYIAEKIILGLENLGKYFEVYKNAPEGQGDNAVLEAIIEDNKDSL